MVQIFQPEINNLQKIYHDEIDEAGEDKVLDQFAADAARTDDKKVRFFGLLPILRPIGHVVVVLGGRY